jgi:hypothetical protein
VLVLRCDVELSGNCERSRAASGRAARGGAEEPRGRGVVTRFARGSCLSAPARGGGRIDAETPRGEAALRRGRARWPEPYGEFPVVFGLRGLAGEPGTRFAIAPDQTFLEVISWVC